MKHLILSFDFPPVCSDIGTFMAGLATHLDPAETTVLTLPAPTNGGGPPDAEAPCTVLRRPMQSTNSLMHAALRLRLIPEVLFVRAQANRTCRVLRRLIQQEDPQFIHCGHLLAGLAVTLLPPSQARPMIVYAHGSELVYPLRFMFGSRLARRIFDRAALVCPTSEAAAGVVKAMGAPVEKLLRVAVPVDVQLFTPGPAPAALAERYGLTGCRVLLATGQLLKWKGYRRLIEALPTVLQAFPDARLLIIGEGPDRAAIEQRIHTFRLEDRVQIVPRPPRRQLVDFYRLAEVVVLPSHSTPHGEFEGLPWTALEAAACAKPLVAGDSGAVPEVVRDGQAGLLCAGDDPTDIARKVCAILGDADLAARLGDAGRRLVETHFHSPTLLDPLRQRLGEL